MDLALGLDLLLGRVGEHDLESRATLALAHLAGIRPLAVSRDLVPRDRDVLGGVSAVERDPPVRGRRDVYRVRDARDRDLQAVRPQPVLVVGVVPQHPHRRVLLAPRRRERDVAVDDELLAREDLPGVAPDDVVVLGFPALEVLALRVGVGVDALRDGQLGPIEDVGRVGDLVTKARLHRDLAVLRPREEVGRPHDLAVLGVLPVHVDAADVLPRLIDDESALAEHGLEDLFGDLEWRSTGLVRAVKTDEVHVVDGLPRRPGQVVVAMVGEEPLQVPDLRVGVVRVVAVGSLDARDDVLLDHATQDVCVGVRALEHDLPAAVLELRVLREPLAEDAVLHVEVGLAGRGVDLRGELVVQVLADARHALVVHVVHALDGHYHRERLGRVLLQERLDPPERLLERQEVVVVMIDVGGSPVEGEVGPAVLVLAVAQVEVLAVVLVRPGRPAGLDVVRVESKVEVTDAIQELLVDVALLAPRELFGDGAEDRRAKDVDDHGGGKPEERARDVAAQLDVLCDIARGEVRHDALGRGVMRARDVDLVQAPLAREAAHPVHAREGADVTVDLAARFDKAIVVDRSLPRGDLAPLEVYLVAVV